MENKDGEKEVASAEETIRLLEARIQVLEFQLKNMTYERNEYRRTMDELVDKVRFYCIKMTRPDLIKKVRRELGLD